MLKQILIFGYIITVLLISGFSHGAEFVHATVVRVGSPQLQILQITSAQLDSSTMVLHVEGNSKNPCLGPVSPRFDIKTQTSEILIEAQATQVAPFCVQGIPGQFQLDIDLPAVLADALYLNLQDNATYTVRVAGVDYKFLFNTRDLRAARPFSTKVLTGVVVETAAGRFGIETASGQVVELGAIQIDLASYVGKRSIVTGHDIEFAVPIINLGGTQLDGKKLNSQFLMTGINPTSF